MTPNNPSVAVLPGQGKTFEAFQADQAVCKQYAAEQVAGQADRANTLGVGGAVLGTVLGAGLGGAIGGGRGAGIGAASGALGGTALGGSYTAGQQYTIQQQYDIAYMQCQYSKGNQVPGYAPGAVGYRAAGGLSRTGLLSSAPAARVLMGRLGMTGVRVKICGINSPEAFDAASEAGADWVGFVFFARSPRHVTPAQAAALGVRPKGGPLRVGLFVKPTDADIEAALSAARLDFLQLYAAPARARQVREKFGVPVWRAVGVAARDDLPSLGDGEDALLIEAKPPDGATRPGGNAAALDWSLLAGWRAPVPWLLAGGLTPDNVVAAIATSGAVAVDVSSGVERAPGVKDAALIRSFVAAARNASPSQPPRPGRDDREAPETAPGRQAGRAARLAPQKPAPARR